MQTIGARCLSAAFALAVIHPLSASAETLSSPDMVATAPSKMSVDAVSNLLAATPGKAVAAAPRTFEPGANTMMVPGQILRTGIDLNSLQLSANSKQLADQLELTPVLHRIASLRTKVREGGAQVTLESVSARQQLTDSIVEAQQILQEANLAVEFTLAEIQAEQAVYQELLSTYQAQANRAVQVSNWASYYSNGALWAVAEALAIPSWKRPKYAISSGINGIIAGVIPSIFSLYSMHSASGRKHPGDRDPNMLSQLFGKQPTTEVQYPNQVWSFLNSPPPGQNKTRKDQLIDRWVADKNIPSFTDRSAGGEIDLITAEVSTNKGVTIDLLQTRETMLSQLSAEVNKIKRLLFELSMAVHGEKQV